MAEHHLEEAKELAKNIESIDGITNCNVDDWNRGKNEFSMFANYEDDANLHSVSQLVRSEINKSDLSIQYFNTPSQANRDWYDFDVTAF